MTDYKNVSITQHEQGREQRFVTFKATQMIWLLLSLLEGAIALRVVFKLIAVNAAKPFATLLYAVTNLFVAPFASLIGALSAEGMVLEISSLIAMLVYLLIAWGIERIVNVIFYRPRGAVSVRQTMVTDHTPPQSPTGVSQTTVTQRTDTHTPGSF